ncbi:uncharacterized protein LOC124916055 [Impatiens glandulifera]|uniref:uncharacterized protein LOC124916055 n=1 Tax=Impatiens glandulifera TaxID=253017 RepID=UPI001FB12E4A|nr:uncharacterized protein LOC124916055 [Impatiens glandulifera]
MAWYLKKILRTRGEAYQMMKFRIGNRNGILFWHDPWLENNPIILREEFQTIRIRIRRKCLLYSIRDIQKEKCSSILRSISERVRILNLINNIQFNGNIDTKSWNTVMNGKFVAEKAWEIIRTKEVVFDWHKVVWSSKVIPRNQFILWLTFRKRLVTRDKIKKYMNIPYVNCPICTEKEESIDHLFRNSTFVSKLWINFAQSLRT